MTWDNEINQIEAVFKGLNVGPRIALAEEWRKRYLDGLVKEAKDDPEGPKTLDEFQIRTGGRVCRMCLEEAMIRAREEV